MPDAATTPIADPIDRALVEAATGPKSYEVDGEKTTMRDVSEIVEADRALRRRRAARNPFGALRFATTGADGNLRKLKDILVDIARVTATMKRGEKIAFFEDIFNARGSLAGGTLAANLPAMERMGETLSHSGGEAHRLAQEMDSGIGGALTRLSSAASGLASDFGKAVSPLVKIAAGAATAALGALSKAATVLGGTFSYLAVVAVGIPSATRAACTLSVHLAYIYPG